MSPRRKKAADTGPDVCGFRLQRRTLFFFFNVEQTSHSFLLFLFSSFPTFFFCTHSNPHRQQLKNPTALVQKKNRFQVLFLCVVVVVVVR